MRFEYTIDIPAPREVVWRVAQDSARRPSWDVRVARYEIDGDPASGAALRITLRMWGTRPVVEGRFLRFDPPLQSAIRLDRSTSAWVMTGGGTWRFDEIPGGTRFT